MEEINEVKNANDLISFNTKLGFLRGIKGIDYFRVLEYSIVFDIFSPNKEVKILDIGSLNSVFPLYLASKGAEVYAIDINEKVMGLKGLCNKLGIKSQQFQQ